MNGLKFYNIWKDIGVGENVQQAEIANLREKNSGGWEDDWEWVGFGLGSLPVSYLVVRLINRKFS